MNDRVLTIPTNPPAIVKAGSGEDYGLIEFSSLLLAAELASKAYRRAEELAEKPDDLATLREAVNDLSDGLNTVVGQLYQIARGIEHGRLTVTQREE